MLKIVKSVLLAAVFAMPLAAYAQEAALGADTPAAAAPAPDAPVKHVKKAKKEVKKDKSASKNVVAVSVTGMHCPACSAKVKAALEKVEGVEKAEVCYKSGKARVTLKSKATLTKGEAEKALADLKGFKVTGVEKCDGKKCKGKKCDGEKCDGKKCDGEKCDAKKDDAKKGKKAKKAPAEAEVQSDGK